MQKPVCIARILQGRFGTKVYLTLNPAVGDTRFQSWLEDSGAEWGLMPKAWAPKPFLLQDLAKLLQELGVRRGEERRNVASFS